MASYAQAERVLSVDTPLGTDAVLLVGFRGVDAISQLFRYRLDLIAENAKDVAFDKVLGQKCTVTFRWGDKNAKKRYFNGICSRISQGERDAVFTSYHIELVPQAWLLTRKAQSRIFQRMTIPDILKKVLTGFDVSYKIQGSFEPRDFCVQYRETDFNFASRLMEEEGIYYFFKHEDGNHTMVLGNTPQTHEDVPVQNTVPYEEKLGGQRDELRISSWEKAQQLRSGKVTLWDHCFELPHKHLETEKIIQDSVSVGSVTHKLKVANNDKLEIYDFPGEYAQRFDGIDKGGGEQSGDLQKIFQDNKRTVEIRMQQEAVASLEIDGRGNCRQFVSGHKFTLQRHFNADGDYVLTSVGHTMTSGGDYRSGQGQTTYVNTFSCIPLALPFRPQRLTPKPFVQGTQSAVVVGPSGEEIFTDKYGRVKVQFHWDRQGKFNAESSCWIRVASAWAGKQWGMINLPRIGQEVLVDFIEGDPDQPVVVGSLYNADMMPPYGLPANKTQSGIQSRSTLQGGPPHYNEFKFEDKKGQEVVHLHAERNLDTSVEVDETHSVGVDRRKTINRNETTDVGGRRTETVGKDEAITIGESRTESVGKNETITIGEDRTESVGKNETITISKDRDVSVGGNESIQISGLRSVSIGKDDTLKVAKTLRVEVGDKLVLTCGSSGIALTKDGTIEITGKDVSIKGSGKVKVQASSDLTLKGSKIAEN
ncbi:MAG TPA: type VI secretion system tip protein TssI/VgrG [Thermoanaerobaculia bacterium]|nr:type VI secretion system tip protein TssI/VgrG [Thermoanaerobaculia bacterium]